MSTFPPQFVSHLLSCQNGMKSSVLIALGSAAFVLVRRVLSPTPVVLLSVLLLWCVTCVACSSLVLRSQFWFAGHFYVAHWTQRSPPASPAASASVLNCPPPPPPPPVACECNCPSAPATSAAVTSSSPLSSTPPPLPLPVLSAAPAPAPAVRPAPPPPPSPLPHVLILTILRDQRSFGSNRDFAGVSF
jgi:hypothetical protein